MIIAAALSIIYEYMFFTGMKIMSDQMFTIIEEGV